MKSITHTIFDAKEVVDQITFSDDCLRSLCSSIANAAIICRVGTVESSEFDSGLWTLTATVSDDFAAAIEARELVIAPDIAFTSDDIVDGVIVRCRLKSVSVVPMRGREVEATL